MTRRAALPALLLLAAGASAAAAPLPAGRFSVYGLAPAAAGQARAQAEAALGQPLQPEPLLPSRAASPAASRAAPLAAPPAASRPTTLGCHYRLNAQQPGVRYVLAGDLITRIETRDARYATLSGIHVGDSVAKAQKVYGKRLLVAAHPYFDRGKMLTVWSPDRRFALVMEANDGGRIITMRSGRMPEVGWLEGCS